MLAPVQRLTPCVPARFAPVQQDSSTPTASVVSKLLKTYAYLDLSSNQYIMVILRHPSETGHRIQRNQTRNHMSQHVHLLLCNKTGRIIYLLFGFKVESLHYGHFETNLIQRNETLDRTSLLVSVAQSGSFACPV